MAKHISMERFELEMTRLSAGWKKHLPSDFRVVYVFGKKFSRLEMEQVLDEIVARLKQVRTTLRAHREAVQYRNDHLPEWFKLQEVLNEAIAQRIGRRPTRLLEFGLAPKRERARPSSEEQTIAAERRRQTRLLRGTMGKKQRLKITLNPEPTVKVLGADGKPLLPPKPGPTSPRLLGPRQPAGR